MEEIYQKLSDRQASFSKNLQKIASRLYKDPQLFAVHSAVESGKQIGVSETTVIRFCKQLGYSGYRELQEEVQQHLFQRSSLADFVEEKSVVNREQPIKSLMMKDLTMIQETMEQLPEIYLQTTVDRLMDADRVLVSGSRTSYALANWFAFSLDIVLGNTRLYQPHVDDILLRIGELTARSVVIVFSFHRYVKDTLHVAKLAQEEGAFVIAFTDSTAAPVAPHADLLIPIQLGHASTLDVAPAVMSVAKAMIGAISLENNQQFHERVKRFDAMNGEDFFN